MGRLILEFKLPDEKPEAYVSLNAGNYYSFLTELKETVRLWVRGKAEYPFKTPMEVLEWLYDELNELDLEN